MGRVEPRGNPSGKLSGDEPTAVAGRTTRQRMGRPLRSLSRDAEHYRVGEFPFGGEDGRIHGDLGEMVWRAIALVLIAALLWPGAASATQSDEPVVRRAIESNIELDPGRQAARLPRVSLDDSNG